MNKFILLFLFVLKLFIAHGIDTRYYGGHIQINHIQNTQFEIEVKLFTHKDSLPPQSIDVDMGDGFVINAAKTDSFELQNNTTLSSYKFIYNYSSSGAHRVYYVDSTSYRQGVNVVNPLPFRLNSTVVISPFVFPLVNPPNFLDYPLVSAIKNSPFHYHPAHVDSISDYLYSEYYTYELVETDDLTVPSGLVINPISGEITWDNPGIEGFYEFTINVHRFRNGLRVNSIQKNVTIYVNDIDSEPTYYYNQNWLTNTEGYYEYRIAPNDNLQLFFAYSDTLADSISVNSVGDAFHYVNPAFFNTVANQNQLYGFFDWTPDNTYVSEYPHRVNFVCHSRIDTIDLYHTLTVLIYVEYEEHLSIASNETSGLNIYPNPTQGMVYIDGSSFESTNRIINVYTAEGKCVLTHQMTTNSLDLSNLDNGVYFIQIQENNNLITKKIILE